MHAWQIHLLRSINGGSSRDREKTEQGAGDLENMQVNKHTTTTSPVQLKISKQGSEMLKMNGSISRELWANWWGETTKIIKCRSIILLLAKTNRGMAKYAQLAHRLQINLRQTIYIMKQQLIVYGCSYTPTNIWWGHTHPRIPNTP